MSQFSQGPGWWLASDGKWYPPQPGAPQAAPAPQWGQTGAAPDPAPRPGANGLAIAALVCGILWGFGFLSIVALVLGIVAIGQTRSRGQQGRGMAIAGVVLGGIGIVGAIASVAVLVAVGNNLSDIGKPAIVAIQAQDDVCWTVTIRNSARTTVRNTGCGIAAFSMGEGLGREAVVVKRSGPGPVTAIVTVEREERDRGTATDSSDSLTVSP